MPSFHYKDGDLVEIPDTIVTESCEIREPVKSTFVIRPGVHVVARARIDGTVTVQQEAILEAYSPVGGTVEVARGGRAVFHDKVGGTIHVRGGAAVTLAPTAVALGTMQVDGVLTNEGTRGVQITGSGEVIDAPGATVRQPDETWADGTVVYRS